MLDQRDIEIDQEAKVFVCKFQMTENLCTPHRLWLINSFQFTDNPVIHKDIHSKPAGELNTMIDDGDPKLAAYPALSPLEFITETAFVDALKESWAQLLVY